MIGIDGGGKAGGDGDDFVAGLERAVAELRRSQGGEGHQVGGGAGVDQDSVADAEEAANSRFELRGEAAGGEPEIERGIDQIPHVRGVEDPAGNGNSGFARRRRAWTANCFGVVFAHQVEDLCTQLRCPVGS